MIEYLPNVIFIFFVLLLPGLVFATGFVQMASVKSQKKILIDAQQKKEPISNSASFQVALDYYESIPVDKFVAFSKGYKVPIAILSLIILMFSIVLCFGYYLKDHHDIYYILAGMSSVKFTDEAVIKSYQTGTLITMNLAFVGAYIVILIRLFRRINNYDINPMSYYFFSLHILQAVLVAAVLRHTFFAMNDESDFMWLAVLGFAVGLKPDLFMQFIAEKAMEKIGKKGPKKVDSASLPSNLPLAMIEGLTEEKRYRLRELDIDNGHQLAEQNPIILWVRTSYQLMHIIDWIAQAQLYLLVKDDSIQKLRTCAIRDIFSFISAAQSGAPSKSKIANLLNIDEALLDSIVQSVEQEPNYIRLDEIRNHLCSLPEHTEPDGSAA